MTPIIILSLALLISLGVIVFQVFELRHVSNIYETSCSLLIADRDQARSEVNTMRSALFPQLSKVTRSTIAPQPPKKVVSGLPLTEFADRRKPFRKLFKDLVRINNTQQRGRDLIAQAITPQPAAEEVSNG